MFGGSLCQISGISLQRRFFRFILRTLSGGFSALLCGSRLLLRNRLGRRCDAHGLKRAFNFSDGIKQCRAHGFYCSSKRSEHDQRRAAIFVQKLLPDMSNACQQLFIRICIRNCTQKAHAGRAELSRLRGKSPPLRGRNGVKLLLPLH